MARIAFFSIYAFGHTNPTLAVVGELTRRGHRVRYYSFTPFQKAIEAAGGEFDTIVYTSRASSPRRTRSPQSTPLSVHPFRNRSERGRGRGRGAATSPWGR